MTYAIHGFDKLTVTDLEGVNVVSDDFQVYPNPATRYIQFSKVLDVALYNNQGQRLSVHRQVNEINVSNLPAGMYYLQTEEGQIKKLIIQ